MVDIVNASLPQACMEDADLQDYYDGDEAYGSGTSRELCNGPMA